ncbi:alpha-mannosidase [Microbacterium indicum]|uniref:alpha-mannosidase n=1 Tax=Microbacterium indicum TaxID=358100 RepID=UPI000419859D|nr:glycoside hydrolase family 38 C-terminal domain-containing protein [Microbacterium indicum]
MHHAPHLVLDRVDRFLGEYLPQGIVAGAVDLQVGAWEVPGEPIPFDEAVARASYVPVKPGDAWGAPWGTTWLRIAGAIPSDWAGRGRIEASIDLGFGSAKPGFQCEGLVRLLDGTAVKGLEPRNHHVPLDADPGSHVDFLVEAASNADLSGGDDFRSPRAFSATPLGDRVTAGSDPLYRFGRMEIRLIDAGVEALEREVRILRGLAAELDDASPRRALILRGLERALYAIDPDAPSRGAAEAREILAPLLAAPASSSAHRVTATGHAHIDSAWLWPSRETVRKVIRTYANVLDLMDRDGEVTFVSSSAQHFAWVKQHDPALFERIRERVAEGRFAPVGGMWVESDVNMPSGESLARQLLYGTRFFDEEFGVRSEVGWLPDSFGYPGSLPQILRRAGIRWFFTQKMSWNDSDAMPHHSFLWEGIDGSRVFTHFPPNNTYSGDMRPTELARSVRNFADHGAATMSLMPFGYGDGGGGPTREMVADARVQADLDGSPRVELGTPEGFFREAEAEYADPPIWSGEMNLQFHRGVFTSQSRTKRGNRRAESLLVEAEGWAAAATVRTGASYPAEELDALWREVLLLQFHDILPGSAIAWVHREAEATHARVIETLEAMISRSLAALVPVGDRELAAHGSSFGVVDPSAPVTIAAFDDGEALRLRSDALGVSVGRDGAIVSIVDLETGRDLLAPGHPANVARLCVDAPARWDAWDLDRSYELATETLVGAARLHGDEVIVECDFGSSRMTQRIGLDETGRAVVIRTRVAWHETRRMLKLAFPFEVHAADAAYETAFGHVKRPLHRNTSWDAARYEVCAHRWVHVGEPGFGVALVNDGIYGHDARRESVGGRVITTVRQSLLRAPTFPDPHADQGDHEFTTLIAPAEQTDVARAWASVVEAPPRLIRGSATVEPLVALDPDTSAEISAIKLAADGSGDVIVRLFETCGARTSFRLIPGFDVARIRECDLVETPGDDVARDEAHALAAFEIRTLRLEVAP